MTLEPKKTKWIGKRIIRPDGVDKVTGRANFGADMLLPGQLTGRILRSPHAHARIKAIRTDKAKALAGVKAIVTAEDFPPMSSAPVAAGEQTLNLQDVSANIMASGKVLYDGHAIAAVAATSPAIAEAALALIEVDYEVLPHVIDVEAAMRPDAPILHAKLVTKGAKDKSKAPTNIASEIRMGRGDVDAAMKTADVVVERRFSSPAVHQGYIEPHACVAEWTEDGRSRIWCSSQGQFMVRQITAGLLEMELSQIRVIPSEIGGGFGGKTTVYLEPVALLLSKKSGRPVRLVMSREEVFRSTGPTSGSVVEVKIGAKKDGTIVAGDIVLKFEAGAFPGSPVGAACMTSYACYDIPNVRIVGYDVVTNRCKTCAYRAPGAPNAALGVECVLDELAQRLGMDPIDLRLKNAAREGTQAPYGPKMQRIGFIETLEAAKAHPHYKAKLGPNQGRGVASGFWFNVGGESSAAVHIGEDGTVVVISPNPDIGGSRASMALMAAEVLGVDPDKISVIVGDTAAIPYSMLTGGSRTTFAVGTAVMDASKECVQELVRRAAQIWEVEPEGVEWRDGHAVPASSNVGKFEPLSLAEIAVKSRATGGAISGKAARNVHGAGPGFATHICDVEIDKDTGRVTVLRYTTVQDVGKAVHPSYVEGQMQGGAAQGIGWALNEEYIFDKKGRLENPGFLDYRMPVTSDLPMIDTVIIEVPNPNHEFGVRGAGEVPIVPPLATMANAVSNAIGKRMFDLPLSPPRILAAIEK